MALSYVDRLRQRLWPRQAGRDVWMIVDGARDRSVYGTLLDSYLEYSCLYHGEISPELEIAAPYLVQLEYDDAYSTKLLQRAWGNSWGILIQCDSSVDTLRRHLRTFLTVKTQAGKLMLFRYYDPRVLRVYLPTCTSEELKTVYGPISRFWTEDESPEIALEFRVERGKLIRAEHPLAPGAAGVEDTDSAQTLEA